MRLRKGVPLPTWHGNGFRERAVELGSGLPAGEKTKKHGGSSAVI